MTEQHIQDGGTSPRKWREDDPRRLRMAEKRTSILAAARPILLRDGLGGATLDRVAAEGGIAKMTLYRHFASKEALFEGLVIEMCGQMRHSIENAPAATASKPFAERLTGELRAFVSALIEPDALALYRVVVADGWRLPTVAQAFNESGMRAIRLRLAALLEAGGVAPRHALKVAGEVVALTLGDAYQHAVLGVSREDGTKMFAQQIKTAVAHAISFAS